MTSALFLIMWAVLAQDLSCVAAPRIVAVCRTAKQDPAEIEMMRARAMAQQQGGVQEMPPGAQPAAAPVAPKKTPDDIRIEKVLQTRFDRRESSILKALHEPPKPKPKPPPPAPETPGWWARVLAKPPPQPGWWARIFTKPPDPVDPVTREIEYEVYLLQRDVTRGDWDAVRKWIDALPGESPVRAYDHLLNTLLMPAMPVQEPPKPWQAMGMMLQLVTPPQQLQPNQMEQNVFLPEDVLALADMSPSPLAGETVDKLGLLLRISLIRGYSLEAFLKRLEEGTERLGGTHEARRAAAVRLLLAANRTADADRLLPSIQETRDAATLNLIARASLAMYEREKDKKKADYLERAWAATEAALASKEEGPRAEALERALRMVSDVRQAKGKAWVAESIAKRPELAASIVAAAGTLASQNRHKAVTERLALLRLQSMTGEALLRSAGGGGTQTAAPTLEVFALAWLREAELTRTVVVQQYNEWEYDEWGNMYWGGYRGRGPQQIPVIDALDLLDTRPSDEWQATLDESMRPKLAILIAQLHLKANEEAKAFACLERVAPILPREARDLANEFLQVWTRNHDPNQDRRRTNRYMYIYGYNPRADGIPLTRSQQVRNLEELAGWVKKLRALPIEDIDEKLIVTAFTSSHSTAEVYKLSDLEKVFGDIGSLKPASLAGLVQTMRVNLAGVWRRQATQTQKNTKRKDKEIEAEVVRGYEVVNRILKKGLEAHPEDWRLRLTLASLAFDENIFRSELAKSPDYSPRRQEAFGWFAHAAELYAKALPGLMEHEQTSEVYETWFYASLGSADLANLKTEQPTDAKQQELIKAAILALPGEAAEKHIGRFASALQTRIQNVKPELKHRYLKGGLPICGPHKNVRDVAKLYDYYDDIVSEIRLTAKVDGVTAVGHGRPFGVFVDIRHTKEIERESGGFTKYLQNQASGGGWYWNFGRPAVDYRDRFEETVREALADRFEMISVTFHSDKIESRGDPERGWRVTPYAYLLIKAKGPEVDSIPSLRIDLDFMDTSGFCVLPIETAKIPIDASAAAPAARPFEKLKIVQTIDERKFAQGRLGLEIRAQGRGLIPDLPQLLDLKLGAFEVEKTDDPGVMVASMDAESEQNGVLSERLWTIDMKVRPHATAQRTFEFGAAKVEAEMVYQRYVDADLATVAREVTLEAAVGRKRSPWPWVAAGIVLTAFAIGLVALLRRRRPVAAHAKYEMPADVNAFSVIALLRRMRTDESLADQATTLDEYIATLERHYFGADGGQAPDLRGIAESFVRRSGNGHAHQEA